VTDEVAVMVDARDPLDICAAAEVHEDRGYAEMLKSKMKLALAGAWSRRIAGGGDARSVAPGSPCPTSRTRAAVMDDGPCGAAADAGLDMLNEGPVAGEKPFHATECARAAAAGLQWADARLCHPWSSWCGKPAAPKCRVVLDRPADVSGRPRNQFHRTGENAVAGLDWKSRNSWASSAGIRFRSGDTFTSISKLFMCFSRRCGNPHRHRRRQ